MGIALKAPKSYDDFGCPIADIFASLKMIHHGDTESTEKIFFVNDVAMS